MQHRADTDTYYYGNSIGEENGQHFQLRLFRGYTDTLSAGSNWFVRLHERETSLFPEAIIQIMFSLIAYLPSGFELKPIKANTDVEMEKSREEIDMHHTLTFLLNATRISQKTHTSYMLAQLFSRKCFIFL